MAKRKDSKKRILREGEYQRSNGSFEYRWRDKLQKRHSIYARTLEELRKKEDEILRNTLNGIRVGETAVTVNDLYARWIQLKNDVKPSTFKTYTYLYEKYIRAEFGKLRLSDLKKTDVKIFYNSLVKRQNLRFSTLNNINIVLSQVLEFGVEDEYFLSNPSNGALKGLKRACTEKIEKRALTVAEQELFEDFLRNDGYYSKWFPFFYIMLWTGMRAGEIASLRWCDVDLEKGEISVNHTLSYVFAYNETPKCRPAINTPKTTASERTIPMLSRVKDVFLSLKDEQSSIRRNNITVDGYTDFIFVSKRGNLHTNSSLYAVLNGVIKKCNKEVLEKDADAQTLLPEFSSHILRHTFTTRMCEAGVNVKVIQKILGHSNVKTTLQIYADVTEDFKKSEMQNLDNYFNHTDNEPLL